MRRSDGRNFQSDSFPRRSIPRASSCLVLAAACSDSGFSNLEDPKDLGLTLDALSIDVSDLGSKPQDEGLHALEFLSAANGPGGGQALASQIWQLAELPDGAGVFQARAWFARTDRRQPSNVDAEVMVWFFDWEPANFPEAYVMRTQVEVFRVRESIIDRGSWRPLELLGDVPRGSRYAAVELRALEETVNREAQEFRNFFVDDACFAVRLQ